MEDGLYISMDPLNDPKSCTYKLKVKEYDEYMCAKSYLGKEWVSLSTGIGVTFSAELWVCASIKTYMILNKITKNYTWKYSVVTTHQLKYFYFSNGAKKKDILSKIVSFNG